MYIYVYIIYSIHIFLCREFYLSYFVQMLFASTGHHRWHDLGRNWQKQSLLCHQGVHSVQQQPGSRKWADTKDFLKNRIQIPLQSMIEYHHIIPYLWTIKHDWELIGIPCGKRLHNYGTSPFLMGKSTISMAIFNSKLLVNSGGYLLLVSFELIWSTLEKDG